jgi:pimeloyl-ACP methyl ester carboxylesterase
MDPGIEPVLNCGTSRSNVQTYFHPQWQACLRFFDLPGTTPACVYLAGLGLASSATYPDVVTKPLLSTRRSILVDFFGSGYSDRPKQFSYSIEDHATTLAALLDHLQLKASVLIGHSMGGAPAIVLATTRPDLVGRLILAESNLDAGGGPGSRSVATQAEADFVSHGYTALLQNTREDGIKGDMGSAAVAGMWQVADPLALHRTAVSLVQGDIPSWREQLYQMQIPRTYVFGEQSLPDPDADLLPAHGVQVVVMPGAGHGMMLVDPEGFAHIVSSLLPS